MPARAALLLLPVIYLGFVSLGLPDGTLGVAWPRMHVALGLPVGLAGTLMLVATLFSAVSSFSSGRWVARFHTGPVVLLSCVLTGSGLLVLSQAQSLWWLWLAAVPLGFGAGAVDTNLNGYVAKHYSGRHMNWLHACWGIGATCGPIIMTQAITRAGDWRFGFLILGATQLTLAGVFSLSLKLWDAIPTRDTHQAHAPAGGTALANSEAGWMSAFIFALYVAIEGTAGVWAGSILVVARAIPQEAAGMCVASYYGSITAGRLLVGLVVDRWGNRRLVRFGLTTAAAGALVFAFANSVTPAAVGLILLGLGFSPVYPCLMHEVPRRFEPSAALVVIARQSSAAYVGGALMPAAAGWLVERISLESVAWTVGLGVLLLAAAIHRLDRIT